MNTRTVFLTAAIGCTLVTARPAAAQAPSALSKWEINAPSGELLPTGTQRDVIKKAPLSALQLSYIVAPALAVTTTVGWARSRDLTAANDPKLDVFTYDVGVEARAPRLAAGGMVSFTPFAGAGAGGRSYNYRSLDVDATHNLAAYGTVGGDVAVARVGLRIEVRDYVAGFKPLSGGGKSDSRNDVVAMFGLHFARHQ